MATLSTRAGAAPYSTLFLRVYDLWVIRLSNSYGWRCNRNYFVDLYRQNIGHRHLEVGPGSGWALANIDLPTDIELTLLDLNANSLAHTASRLNVAVRQIQHDVLVPLDEGVEKFDSVSINYVLHCLPGDWSTKGAALTNLAGMLKPEGVLFGSTVIGVDQRFTVLGTALMFAYNKIGAFGNRRDDLPGLRRLLSEIFEQVEVTMVGNVAIFVARGPRTNM
ncbi:class I SAM-dependent methyltransferase [Rhodococcoides yunnanense]|uniref:Class I SAM-dependent methyltransferase n=1 Tax=Rhodococcoides yunnanense TaxID=278209 RepID=A0ABU4BC93_9NOCA|nr:class I SAM-dependent methyltransferase [Rhodococcus yunnanensis]MDV6261795.1 class I SAM-dependent methyltransferase [Rhodococcus yunnanensis]